MSIDFSAYGDGTYEIPEVGLVVNGVLVNVDPYSVPDPAVEREVSAPEPTPVVEPVADAVNTPDVASEADSATSTEV